LFNITIYLEEGNMKNFIGMMLIIFCIITTLSSLSSCGKNKYFGKKAIPLLIEEVAPTEISGTKPDNPAKDGDPTLMPTEGLHPIFSAPLGSTIPSFSMGVVDADPTGLSVINDWDGDGVPNDLEVMSSSLVADYPRIVTRVTAPIIMELRKSEIITSENYTETIENTDTKETINNSMENKHYALMNTRTTPYVVKESQSTDNSNAYSYGDSSTTEYSGSLKITIMGNSQEAKFDSKKSNSQNWSISNRFAQSTMSEKTVFQDVDYVDNLDRNSVEMKDEKVQSMSTNFRNSEKTKEAYEVGPNAGYLRAGLYIKNDTVNMPVRISNVICTLSFRTAGGAILPVKTFRLRNDDYSEFDHEVYGGEEIGPFTIEVTGLNTFEIKQALRNGYTPQITVVSHDMHRVEDSNYNPGVYNLKIIEETAKSRTALIKIVGTSTRDIYRVAAFDIDDDGNISPGISLKKALFNILSDRIGKKESWALDNEKNVLTVPESGLKWKEGFMADEDFPDEYTYSTNTKGNKWRLFETYVKSYTDEYNKTRRIETIKRIGALKAYNPFSIMDNPNYNPNEFLERDELMKMKYWIILHNGRYFEGDLNDPIWAGERYEIVCMDIRDFNDYFKTYSFTPVQSMEYFTLDTSWNRLSNAGEFARSRYLGRVVRSDVVHLEINLAESRFLFDEIYSNKSPVNKNDTPVGAFNPAKNNSVNEWYGFNYTIESDQSVSQGIPVQFSHYAEGGFNNIKVTINESKNANDYEIFFRVKDDADAQWKNVRISADEVRINNGEVFITSQSRDDDGKPLGPIQGRLLSAGGLEYVVNVKANGKVNNVPVSTWSMSNNKDEAIAVVYDTDTLSEPGGRNGFTFSAAGLVDNWIYIRLSDADYTEYFNIVITGPYNYPYNGYHPPLIDENAPLKTYIGHRGLNKIKIPNPSGDVREDGIYKIMAYALNKNCGSGGRSPRPAQNDCVYISVAHDRYAAQRIYKPRLNQLLVNMKSIDLEVNFNDGSGWYRLKLDPGEWYEADQMEDKRIIDCRFNSYINYDTQKFHVFFKPPCGVYDEYSKLFAGNHDVFAGGRETVDLYIRTVPEPRYRVAFWLKNQGSDIFSDMMNYIVTPYYITPDFPAEQYTQDEPPIKYVNFINFWINSELSDASNIEDSLATNKLSTGEDFNAEMHIGFKGTDLENFFFSPLEYRKYDIRASLVEKLPQQQKYVVDPPKFYAQAVCLRQQEGSGVPWYSPGIVVNNIGSQYASNYEVFYKLVNPIADPVEPLIGPDENPLNWNSIRIEEDGPVNALGFRDVIIPVDHHNQRYLIAVIGYNMYGRSEPSYFDGSDGITAKSGDVDNRAKVSSVFVYNCNEPSAPTIDVALNPSNNRQIDVTNIFSDGAVRYLIEWKESQEDWDAASRHDANVSGQASIVPVSYSISRHRGFALRPWKKYHVRVVAETLDGRQGSYSNVMSAVTGTDFIFSPGNLAWKNVTNVHDGDSNRYYSDLVFENVDLPAGTVRYSINAMEITQYGSGRDYCIGGDQYCTKTSSIELSNTFALYNQLMLYREHFFDRNIYIRQIDVGFTITVYNENGDSFTSDMYRLSIGKPKNTDGAECY
jgi:hypothetical protein